LWNFHEKSNDRCFVMKTIGFFYVFEISSTELLAQIFPKKIRANNFFIMNFFIELELVVI
jgi:hypothetical protein